MDETTQHVSTAPALLWPLRVAVIVGLIVLLPLTVSFGVATFLDKPDHPSYPRSIVPAEASDAEKEANKKLVDAYNRGMEAYRAALERFNKRAFWVSSILASAFMAGGFFRKLGDVATGMLAAGVILAGVCQIQYDTGITDQTRFIGLLAASALLLAVGWVRLYRKA